MKKESLISVRFVNSVNWKSKSIGVQYSHKVDTDKQKTNTQINHRTLKITYKGEMQDV